jgi:O-acetyl-ADP-ribose deacetylase (regulator of RNase III)
MIETFMNGRVIVKVGNITDEDVDAIVNAANSTLLGGGGVDGAIHERGGPQILAECKAIIENEHPDGLATGRAVITTAGDLPARFVIHTVGPVFGENDGLDPSLLAKCYIRSLSLAAGRSLRSIAFPSISTGAYSYPRAQAAEISSLAIKRFLPKSALPEEIRLVFFSDENAEIFLRNHAF